MRGQRAERQLAVLTANVRQITAQAAHVDQPGRLSKSELHQRQQALSAGNDRGVAAASLTELDRFIERCRSRVLETRWDHDVGPSPCYRGWRAACNARHTRCGVNGMSRSFTPSGASASKTALATVGVDT